MRRLFLFSTLLLAGCATRPPASSPTPAPLAVPPMLAPGPPMTPAQYLASSSSRSLLLVRASELAAARAPEIAAEAERVAAAHRGVAAQLNLAGRRLNLLPSAELEFFDRFQLDRVRKAENVVDEWRRVVRISLASCEQHESAYVARGTSPTLRPVARFALGVCREELARRR